MSLLNHYPKTILSFCIFMLSQPVVAQLPIGETILIQSTLNNALYITANQQGTVIEVDSGQAGELEAFTVEPGTEPNTIALKHDVSGQYVACDPCATGQVGELTLINQKFSWESFGVIARGEQAFSLVANNGLAVVIDPAGETNVLSASATDWHAASAGFTYTIVGSTQVSAGISSDDKTPAEKLIGQTITIRSDVGYVWANDNPNDGSIYLDPNQPGTWGEYQVEAGYLSDTVSFKHVAGGNYLGCDPCGLDDNGILKAHVPHQFAWESFSVIEQGDRQFSFVANNGKTVFVDARDGFVLRAADNPFATTASGTFTVDMLGVPNTIAENTPEQTPVDTPLYAPEPNPDIIPEIIPDPISESVPDPISEVGPELIPELIPDMAPEPVQTPPQGPGERCFEPDRLVCNTVGVVNQKGTHCGLDFEIYSSQPEQQSCMTLTAGGFESQWNLSDGNYLARKGINFEDRSLTVSASDLMDTKVKYRASNYQPSLSGISLLSVYGWTRDPLIEYYIVDSWGLIRPPYGPKEKLGTVTIPGEGRYDVYRAVRREKPSIDGITTFDQYFSVRTQKRTSGTVSVGKHFEAWQAFGLTLGRFYEVTIKAEGNLNRGAAKVDAVIEGF